MGGGRSEDQGDTMIGQKENGGRSQRIQWWAEQRVKGGCLNCNDGEEVGGQRGSKGGPRPGWVWVERQQEGGKGAGEFETTLVIEKPRGAECIEH